MKNKKLLTVAMLAGLTLGGLSVASVASAQSYGSDTDTTEEVQTDTTGNIVQVQVEADEAETEADDGEDSQREGRNGHRGGCNLDAAAEAIGIDEADLAAALESGDTIADVAEANGVAVDTVIDAMVNAKADRIAEKVEDGRITQDEADQKLADTEAKITNRVNGVEDADEA